MRRDRPASTAKFPSPAGLPELSEFRFRPTLFGGIGLLFLLPCLAALGIWQLHRADEKRAIETQNEERRALAPIVLTAADEARGDLLYRMVVARGRYLPGKVFFLDNQINEGKAGYHVVSSFVLDSQTMLLVNRGWVPTGTDRSRLPAVNTPGERLSVLGRIRDLPDVGIRLENYSTGGSAPWPKVVQYLEAEQASQWLGKPILPFLLQLDPEQNHGYKRNWADPVIMKAEKHVAYAIQWFSIALVALIICLKQCVHRRDA